MAKYNFKSVGKTQQQQIVEQLESKKTPIGIKTPLQINDSGSGEILITYDNLIDTVKDNLRNLLLTNWGERLGLYNFGANLFPMMSDLSSAEEFDSKAIEKISAAVNQWMPYISLENYVSSIDHSNNDNGMAHVNIKITYSIPMLNFSNGQLEINLYAM